MKFFILTILFLFQPAFAEVSTIAVTGRAEKAVDPDIVNIQIEIWAKSNQAKQAQENIAKEYQRIKNVLEKFKIKKEDYQTISYSLNPEHEYNNNYSGGSKIVGHRAAHGIWIILKKVEEAGQLVDALGTQATTSSQGVNVRSIGWDYSKRKQVEVSLIDSAVQDAKIQADELAKASGSKIKGVYRLSRQQGGGFYPPAPMAMMEKADSHAATELGGGSIKIDVQVSAEYLIQ